MSQIMMLSTGRHVTVVLAGGCPFKKLQNLWPSNQYFTPTRRVTTRPSIPATAADASLLPAVERSAGQAFTRIPSLAWIASDDPQSEQRHLDLIRRGVSWVAIDNHDAPIGFLNGEVLDGNLHVWEMSVHADHQAKGIGRALMAEARHWAIQRELPAITLTTFRDVPWNERFYKSVGFATLQEAELTAALKGVLDEEIRHGLPGDRRCVMRWENSM